MGLAGSLNTLDYAYLSETYGTLGKLKIRRKQFHGGSIPPPGTILNTNITCGIRCLPRSLGLCVFDVFRSILRSGTSSGTVRIRPISNNLNRLAVDFITASFRYLRQITGCAADLVSKHEFPAPSSRSQVHIARLARAGAACGRAWMR
jgi:hypothetical protein